VRVHERRRGCSADARPARSDPDLDLGCDPVEGMTTWPHLPARRRRIEAAWAGFGPKG
jgi:hypothetical protein